MCLNQWFLDALPVFYGQVKHGVSDTLVRNDIHDSLLEFQIKILKREYKIEFPAPRLEKCTSLLLEHGATRMESLRKCLCLSYHLPAPWSDTLIDVLLSPKVCGALTKFGLDLFLLDLVNQRQDTLNLCLDSAVYLDVMINVGLVVLPGRFPRAKSDLLRAVVGKWDVSVAEAVWAHLSDSLTALLEKPSASAELLYMIIRLVCGFKCRGEEMDQDLHAVLIAASRRLYRILFHPDNMVNDAVLEVAESLLIECGSEVIHQGLLEWEPLRKDLAHMDGRAARFVCSLCERGSFPQNTLKQLAEACGRGVYSRRLHVLAE